MRCSAAVYPGIVSFCGGAPGDEKTTLACVLHQGRQRRALLHVTLGETRDELDQVADTHVVARWDRRLELYHAENDCDRGYLHGF